MLERRVGVDVAEISFSDDLVDGENYSLRVGERLRLVRRQKRMSLQEVEAESSYEFKASVLGAYERGERAISVPRLSRLAHFYEVPVGQLLPLGDGINEDSGSMLDRQVTINLDRLARVPGAEAAVLGRFLTMIQGQRQEFNGSSLTIRRDDLRTIACILDTALNEVADRLDELGVRLGA
ncbi:MAG: transcriptional regulator [Acidimicrobiaceae bacterium]|nr:transcriptional regulator [Acidimicrobiaceae bacterium]|tara:strand:- start:79 stop:618 length:540 start_codon:yes stop_codon:yes gene_type:complete